jgi:hypothetical protein
VLKFRREKKNEKAKEQKPWVHPKSQNGDVTSSGLGGK